MMYITRTITPIILESAKTVPVITVVGPRQSGKSTLCKQIFPHHAYVDLQEPNNLAFATTDPKGFLETHTNEFGLIIDEAQYAPILFAQIKVEVDKQRSRMGRFILSGSQNFLMNEKITETLSGRVYIFTLLPLSLHELNAHHLLLKTPEQQIEQGFYPNLYVNKQSLDRFYESYFFTYVERDVRALRNIENLLPFQRFIQLCVARIGQPLNVQSLSNEAGISVVTTRAWLSILQASFILFLLPAYHANTSKRMVKSPKLFFYDVGLALHIAALSPQDFVENRALLGQFFENMMIVDLMKECLNNGLPHRLYFYRDTNQNEIDLIIALKGAKIPVEIKASQTLNPHFFDTISRISKELRIKQKGVVIYTGTQDQKGTMGSVLPWNQAYEIIRKSD